MATRQDQKAKARKANRETRPHAVARYVRISPRKVKSVIDMVRGKSVAEAEAILTYSPGCQRGGRQACEERSRQCRE